MATDCKESCRREVVCRKCGKTKAPHGRSIAPAMAGVLCDTDCPDYFNDPRPGHLWPREEFPERTWSEPA
jgi:hypothetical protein